MSDTFSGPLENVCAKASVQMKREASTKRIFILMRDEMPGIIPGINLEHLGINRVRPASQPLSIHPKPVAADFFQQLVDTHHAALYRFAYSLAKSEAAACDLTQQTFYIWATKGHTLREA